MTNLFVLDTNVLLNDHLAPMAFEGNTVIIPLAVLEELDAIKMRKNDLSRDARAAIRVLEDIIGDSEGNLQHGIKISESGEFSDVHPEATLIIGTMPTATADIPNDMPDNIIINTALEFEGGFPDQEVTLISNDINMRLKAKGAGLKRAKAYSSDRVVEDTDYLPTGAVEVEDEWLDDLSLNPLVQSKSCGGIAVPLAEFGDYTPVIGSWFYNENEEWAAHVDDIGEDAVFNGVVMVHATFKKISVMKQRRCAGVTGRSIQQAIAIDALLDKNKDIVVLFGAAGSGKTLLATAAATEMVKGKKKSYRMEEIIFGKTMDSQFEEIGFLKGSEHEKMAPWAGAVYDNMEAIARISKNKEYNPEHSIDGEDAFIKLKSLGFMRGRSLSHKVLIIDEAQNINAKQMKTLLSRAGENCKVILMGNLSQIDNNLTENSSGLTYICQKLNNWERAAIIHLEGVERSPLAEFVENNF